MVQIYVSRLRKADLVASTRGAHGGYELSRDPAEITMAEVVQALEGSLVESLAESLRSARGIYTRDMPDARSMDHDFKPGTTP